MGRPELFKEIDRRVAEVLSAKLDVRDGTVVPAPEDVAFDEGVYLETTALIIDMRDSSDLSQGRWRSSAAKIYKAFFGCVVRCVSFTSGLEVVGFAGDRLLAISEPDDERSTRAWRAAVLMQSAIKYVLNPRLKKVFGHEVRYGIGLADGPMLAVRVGIRGSNDLVWAGDPVNVASKLADKQGNSGIRIEATTWRRTQKNTNCTPEGPWDIEVGSKKFRYYYDANCGYHKDLKSAGLT